MKETLEEAAERHRNGFAYQNFIRGAKWQAERMHSEEDLKQFAFELLGEFLSNNEGKIEIKLAEVYRYW